MFSSCTQKENNVMRKMHRVPTVGERDVSGCPAYILAAVDELVYGHHPVFIFIHLLLERGKDNDEEGFSKASLLWLTVTERRALPTTHLPERILLHADEASPLWGRGMCIFPSCRRWPSWCLAFPTTHRKELFRKHSNGKQCRHVYSYVPETSSYPRIFLLLQYN